MNDWITHDGGPAPVRRAERVDVRWRNGEEHLGRNGEYWVWTHSGEEDDVIAYRLAQPEPAACEPCWWCVHCHDVVAPQDVTYDERHDPRAGGCDQKVSPRDGKPSKATPPEPLARDMTKRERFAMDIYCAKVASTTPDWFHANAIGDSIREADALLAALEVQRDA